MNNPKFKSLNLNEGDVVEITSFSAKVYTLENNIETIQSFRNEIRKNTNTIASLLKEIDKADEELKIIQNSQSAGSDGDVGNPGGFASMSSRMT